MNKFQVINWSDYMRASECLGNFGSLDSAMNFCKHQTPYNWDDHRTLTFEEYSEVTELDQNYYPVKTYYFISC